VGGHQGDRIGRIFTQWAITFFVQFSENYRSSSHFWAPLFHALILTRSVRATFWAIFSQTHLFTLAVIHKKPREQISSPFYSRA
jgi:hypothetical protein